jgi:hypothetical protein
MATVSRTSTTVQSVPTVDHPYRAAGIVLVVIGVLFAAYDLGLIFTCGRPGLCFTTYAHGIGYAALIIFFVFLALGIALIAYTSNPTYVAPSTVTRPASTTVVESTTTPSPPTYGPTVTNPRTTTVTRETTVSQSPPPTSGP